MTIENMLTHGILIKFSGSQGVGKTTAMKMIHQLLQDNGWTIPIMDDGSHEMLVLAPEYAQKVKS